MMPREEPDEIALRGISSVLLWPMTGSFETRCTVTKQTSMANARLLSKKALLNMLRADLVSGPTSGICLC